MNRASLSYAASWDSRIKKPTILSIAAIGLLAFQSSVGHHSDAGIDMTSIVAFEGTVSKFVWRNPHVYVVIVATNDSGETVDWDMQMGAVSINTRRGWRKDTLQPGDEVTVRAHVSIDGRPYGIIESIDKEGGLGLEPVSSAPQSVATTLSGNWIADRAATMSYPGGFDGFFNALLVLNDKGRAAKAAYDPLSDENPEATCVGRPTPSALVSTSLYLMQIEIQEEQEVVIIRSERNDEVRTVHMDGRGHPDPSERFITGHSIGEWDGDTLVVDTRNFADHRSPYQNGVPSGGQKHVVERYRLSDDGRNIELQFTLDDPEYLVEAMSHSRPLMYSPHLEMFSGKCDLQSTSRFIQN